MKILVEKKKMFALIALFCLAAVLLINAIGSITDLVGDFKYMFSSFGRFLYSASINLSVFFSVLTSVGYVCAALLVWKTGEHKRILGISGICTLIALFLGFVAQIIFFIIYEYFDFGMLLSNFLGDVMPFLFAAYLIAFSLFKLKGPAVPVAGAVLIALLCGSEILDSLSSIIKLIPNIFKYFNWNNISALLKILWNGSVGVVCCAGLLLLVPAAFYLPKEEAEATAE